MNHPESKIGYSDIGGIYIAKNIKSDFHINHTITIIISFAAPFEIALKNGDFESYQAVTIQKDVRYKFQSSKIDHTIFLHLDPYSEAGIKLTQKKEQIQKLEFEVFTTILENFKTWFKSSSNNENDTEYLLNEVANIIAKNNADLVTMDARIKKSIQLIKQNENEKLSIQQIADSINISPSHFAYLFKKEIGLSFRKFLLHRKLITALQAMHKRKSLTDTSFLAGFSDQPHFSRTFKKAFGIKPSSTKK